MANRWPKRSLPAPTLTGCWTCACPTISRLWSRSSLPLLSDEELAWRRQWAETLRAETDKALLGDFGFNLGRWGSYGEWFYGIAADPDYTRAWYDLKIENLLANVERYRRGRGRQHRRRLADGGLWHAEGDDDLAPHVRSR